MLTPTNSCLLYGFYTSVSILTKINQDLRPREGACTDGPSDRRTGACEPVL